MSRNPFYFQSILIEFWEYYLAEYFEGTRTGEGRRGVEGW